MLDLSSLSPILGGIDDDLQNFDVGSAQSGERLRGANRQAVRFYLRKEARPVAKTVKINPVTGSTTVLETEMKEVVREFVEIIDPGDKRNIVDQPAEDYHRRQYFKQYRAFKNGTAAPIGKPLDECSYVPSPTVTELRYHNCHTEEQLADASDNLCSIIPNGQQLREFARAAVKANMDNQSLTQVMALQEKNKDLEEKLAQVMAQVSELAGESPVKRGPGRPRKEEPLIAPVEE